MNKQEHRDKTFDELLRIFAMYASNECCAHHALTIITYATMAFCRIVGLDIRTYANMMLEDVQLIELKTPTRKEQIQ